MKTNKEIATAFYCGKFATAGHLHTDGENIFSYSTLIAQKQTNGTILINSRDYSSTTRRHKAHIFNACTDTAFFEVPHIDRPTTIEHAQNLVYLENIAHDWRMKANKARTDRNRQIYASQAEQASHTASDYFLLFCL